MVHQFMKHVSCVSGVLKMCEDWCTYKSWRLVNFSMVSGMGPVNRLFAKSLFMRNMKMSVLRFLVQKNIAEDGSQFMKHISFDLWCTDKYWRLVNSPMDSGMGPVNWLSGKFLFMRNMKMSVMLFLVLSRAIAENGSPAHEPLFRSSGVLTSAEDGSISQWTMVWAL